MTQVKHNIKHEYRYIKVSANLDCYLVKICTSTRLSCLLVKVLD